MDGHRYGVFVGFSTPRVWNPLSWAIRAATRSKTSHAWLLVEDPAFELRLVLEAHSTGFRLVSFTRFVKTNKVVALAVPRPVDALAHGLPAAGEWLGAKFDVVGLFGMLWVLIGRWVAQRPWRNPFPTPSALFCSEAVVRTMKEAHYPGSAELGNETTTPADLLAWLAKHGCEIIPGSRLNLWTKMKPHRRVMRPPSAGAPASGGPPAAAGIPVSPAPVARPSRVAR